MQTRLDAAELERRANELSWHHQIDLGHGVVTPGLDHSQEKLADLKLPSLAGKSVLDVGAWDGYFSFAAERLGASRVVALDSFAWGGAEWGSQDSFNFAREVFDSKVEDVYCEVLDISTEKLGHFDVVFFLGVLYHMRHPFLALERVSNVCDELLVIETLADMTFTRHPAAAFYPGSSMNNDETNWWGPNAPAVVAMLMELGFKRVEIVNKRTPLERASRFAYNAAAVARSRVTPSRASLPVGHIKTDRLMVHAYR
jgi:tRNA (mo5U34)-methyltransferase